jgi:hypothetical protein
LIGECHLDLDGTPFSSRQIAPPEAVLTRVRCEWQHLWQQCNTDHRRQPCHGCVMVATGELAVEPLVVVERTRAGRPSRPRHQTLVTVLAIPADPREPALVIRLEATAAALSEAIGGGLLDDDGQGEVSGERFTLYVDEERCTRGLALNDRAARLSARLGLLDRRWLAQLRGDALLVGLGPRNEDRDVPLPVLTAAFRSGLTPQFAPGLGGTAC